MVVLSKEQDLEGFLDILRPFGKPLLFGSQVIGTHLSGSDTDISLIVVKKGEVQEMTVPDMKELMSRLKQNGKVEFISKSKIPVIHVTYRASLFDVVINESGCVLSSWLLEDMLKSNEKALNVVLTIKQWAVGISLIGAAVGKLSSHAITLFTVHCLMLMGMLGLAHLGEDHASHTPLWTKQEMHQHALCWANRHGPRDNLWWMAKPRRRRPPFLLGHRKMVRRVFENLVTALKQPDFLIHSLTTRVRTKPSSQTSVCMYIEDPVTRTNAAASLTKKEADVIKMHAEKALTHLSRTGTDIQDIL
jgi:hypothetical protein